MVAALNAGLNLSASRYQSKNFIKVVDALSSDAGGEGTDILFDIEEIMFNDDHVSLATRKKYGLNTGEEAVLM